MNENFSGDLEDLMQEIIAEARKLVGAERCSLFLVSDDKTELVAKVKIRRKNPKFLFLFIYRFSTEYLGTKPKNFACRLTKVLRVMLLLRVRF